MSPEYRYPRPSLTADCLVFSFRDGALCLLLIERSKDPFAGRWALPGGFVDEGEDPAEAARRELMEETGIARAKIEQLGAFGKPGRDPRGWVVSVAYLCCLRPGGQRARAGDDAGAARWHKIRSLPKLAFDHREIVRAAAGRLRHLTRESGLLFDSLPTRFSKGEAESAFADLFGRQIDFSRTWNNLNRCGAVGPEAKPTPEKRSNSGQLFQFHRKGFRAGLEQEKRLIVEKGT